MYFHCFPMFFHVCYFFFIVFFMVWICRCRQWSFGLEVQMLYCLPLLVRGGGLLPASRQQCWTALVSELFFGFENWIYKFFKHCNTRRSRFDDLETLELRHYNWCYFSRHIFWPGPSEDTRQSLCVHRVCGEFLRCERIGCPTLRPITSSSHQAGPTKHNRVLSLAGNDSGKLQDWRPTTGRKRAIKMYFSISWDFW